MLTVHQLAKSFDLQTLFNNVTFSINPGDRAGLVGPNGCGKTTLLRIIAGQEEPSSGTITMDSATRIGYLPQGFELDDGATVGEITGRAAGDIAILENDLVNLSQALAQDLENSTLQDQYDALLQRISTADPGRTAVVLSGLGLDDVDPELPVGRLSGGQKTRLSLALVLLDDPHLLLLDEPTNHLDIAMLEWLEGWLAGYGGGALIVSHDRTFLDRSITRVLAMDAQKNAVREYAGNYSEYADQVARELEKQWATYHDQQGEIRRVKQDMLRTRAQAERTEREASSVRIGGPDMALKGYKDYQQGIAKKVASKAKAREKKLERYLESDNLVERPQRSRDMKLDFGHSAHLGRSVIGLRDLTAGYLPEIPLLKDLRLDVSPGARIVITGPNGSGKTTLLRTIAGRLRPLSGAVEIGPSVQLGYMTQEQTDLDPALSPLQTIQNAFENETQARTFLAYFLFTGDEPLKLNSQLSFGQRARLALAKMVVTGCNVLLLDEPINHLDIPAREQFEKALSSYAGTVLAVLHDRYFIERFASEIWWVEDQGIRREIRG